MMGQILGWWLVLYFPIIFLVIIAAPRVEARYKDDPINRNRAILALGGDWSALSIIGVIQIFVR